MVRRLSPVRGTGQKLRVRRATLRDIDILVRQRRAMWIDLGLKDGVSHDMGDRVYRKWALTRLRRHELVAWVVESRDGIVAGGGCLWLQPVQPRPHRRAMFHPYLLSMYTEPRFRRRGVASMVVAEAVKWSVREGYERVMLHASEMGMPVYRGLGFKRTSEMRLDLTKPVSFSSRRRRAR